MDYFRTVRDGSPLPPAAERAGDASRAMEQDFIPS